MHWAFTSELIEQLMTYICQEFQRLMLSIVRAGVRAACWFYGGRGVCSAGVNHHAISLRGEKMSNMFSIDDDT